MRQITRKMKSGMELPRKSKLKRINGTEYISSHALAIQWAERRADPNGYYEILDLPAHRPVLMWEIKPAYEEAVRRYHPDTASDGGSPELLEVAMCAWEVLSDPRKRKVYDNLPMDRVWMDRRMREMFYKMAESRIRREAHSVAEYEEMMDSYKKLLEAEHEEELARIEAEAEEEEEAQQQRARDYETVVYQYYLDRGVAEVSTEVVHGWLRVLASAFWRRRINTVVRLGFTKRRYRIQTIAQDTVSVIMVHKDMQPESLVAMWLVHEELKTRPIEHREPPKVKSEVRDIRKLAPLEERPAGF